MEKFNSRLPYEVTDQNEIESTKRPRKQVVAAGNWNEKLSVGLYGRRLSAIEKLVQKVWAYKAIGEDDDHAWGEVREMFTNLLFPALKDDNRPAFKELIAAMQWANINVKHPPGPRKSKAAMLRYQVTAMSETTQGNAAATKRLLEQREIEDIEDSDIARAKRDVFGKTGNRSAKRKKRRSKIGK